MGRQKHGSARLIQDGYHGCHRGQSYISQIENGQKQLVSLLTDYAQEVGAQIKYVVDPAEKKPKGNRLHVIGQVTSQAKAFVKWQNGDYSSEDASIQMEPPHGDTPSEIPYALSSGTAVYQGRLIRQLQEHGILSAPLTPISATVSTEKIE
jgi:predicted MPP superfamily phosphohydrolase